MKKTFSFNIPNKNRDRQEDAIKFEVKKYIARERRKQLPKDADFWDFDCRIGINSAQAVVIPIAEINTSISKIAADQAESFYLEILVKPGIRKKEKTDSHF
jgi:hypothetical protein